MLHEQSVLHDQNVSGDPVVRPTVAGKAAVQHHKVVLREDKGVVVMERGWGRPDEVEQTVAAGRYVGAVLDVIG